MSQHIDGELVEIRVDGRCLQVDGELPADLANRFASTRRVFDRGIRVRREPQIDSENQIANQGLFEPLVAELNQRRIRWRASASLFPTALDPTMDSQRAREFLDGDVIEFVNGNLEGIIAYSPGVSPVRVLVQVANAFPDLQIAMLANSGQEVDALSQQLRSHGIPVTAVVRRQIGDDEHVQRIVVTTPFGVEESGVELQQRDLVFFANARHATHTQAEYEISKSGGCFRLFAFLPLEQRLANYDRDRLARIFGLRRICVPRHGHRATDVRVEFLPIQGARIPECQSPLEVKRAGVFGNHVRNRLIAKVARQLSVGDPAAYDQLWREISTECRTPAAKTVAVVVENVAHAEKIRKRLRGWPVWTGSNERRVPDNPCVARSGFGQITRSETSELICTIDGLPTAPLQNTDVIIWAASGPRGPQIPQSRLVQPYGSERPLLIIDVVDTQHPQLVAWNHCRQRDYFTREWIPIGCDRTDVRIHQFLRARA